MTTAAPPFRWSKSLSSAFRECTRKGVLSHLSKGDADPSHPGDVETHRLRQLKNRHLWISALVHEALREVLQAMAHETAVPSIEDLLGVTREKMRTEFTSSRENADSEFRLFEHHYDQAITKEVWQSQWARVEKSLRWFYGSPWFERLKTLGPESWKVIDELISFDLEGTIAYVKIDCGVDLNEKIHLVDWKTSPLRETDKENLRVAALYAHDVWGASPGDITMSVVSLADGKTARFVADEESLMETHLMIQEESARMMGELTSWSASPLAAPPATNPNTCSWCNFQNICFPKKN